MRQPTSVNPHQRYTAERPCPVCNGHSNTPRGQGIRCVGFLSDDGAWAHCTRENFAGGLKPNFKTTPPTYAHRLDRACQCGNTHVHSAPPGPELRLVPKPSDRPDDRKPKNHRQIAKISDYLDESGALAHQTVKYRPKGFSQRRPDPDQPGQYIPNLQGIREVLYRLPQLLASSPAEVVHIGEGEKDADRLAELGFVSTTNAMGAKHWKSHFNDWLEGHPVVIYADNDADGEAGALRKATALHSIAASVKIVRFPGTVEGADVSDYLDTHSAAELLTLVDQAPEWTPSKIAADKPQSLLSSVTINTHGEGPSFRPLFPHTDLGNAERLVERHGNDFRWCPEWRCFIVWDEKRWIRSSGAEIMSMAMETIKAMYSEATLIDGLEERQKLIKHALASESAHRLEAMTSLAKAMTKIQIHPGDLDRHQLLLNCQNGTIDLTTCQLREHRRTDFLTKVIPISYDPQAKAPLWEAFLDRIMAGRGTLISFLQRAAGYSSTGHTVEQVMFFLFGGGRNGKSVFVGALQYVLGEYARSARPETIMTKHRPDIPNDVAALAGARFVPTIEVADGGRLAENLVKQMTGGDLLVARFLHGEYFEFKPAFKIWLVANHKPTIRGTDIAIWERILLVPFAVTIPPEERDHHLAEKLEDEGPGILAWVVEGCREWGSRGLRPPEEVRQATKEYQAEMDDVATFIEECCVVGPDKQVRASHLWESYKTWCAASGEHELTQKRFGASLTERGHVRVQQYVKNVGATIRIWQGIGLGSFPSFPSFPKSQVNSHEGDNKENTRKVENYQNDGNEVDVDDIDWVNQS